MRTDGDVVRKLRTLDALLERVRNICNEIAESEHPNAAKIAAVIDEQCVSLAWPSHIAHRHLEHPERWESGAHDIRRRRS